MNDTASAIGREIQQTKPFRSTSQEATLALYRTADVLHRLFDTVIEPHGITGQQYNVLRILRGAEPAGLPTLAIAGRMVERQPGITRMLDRLETKGLVRRERGTADRRCVHCRITEPGLALLARLDAPVDAADDLAFAALTGEEQRQLIALLDRVRAAHDAAARAGGAQ